MKIGILGSGGVGKKLAAGFIKYGYSVKAGSRSPEKLESWKKEVSQDIQIGTFEDAAKFGEIIVLATKGTVAKNALELAGIENLEDKIIFDATNPIADAPPENGVLKFFTSLDESLMEQLQRHVPLAHFVKVFSSVGAPLMVDPKFETKPTMFICGNNDGAKKQAVKILDHFGWETEDMGGAEAARAIEPLCILWCIPGFRENRWAHAFKLLKA